MSDEVIWTGQLNVTACEHKKSGTSRTGKPWSLYIVSATKADGSPVPHELASFEQLPTGVGEYELTKRVTDKGYTNYGIRKPGRGGGGGGGLGPRVEALERQVNWLVSEVNGLKQLVAQLQGGAAVPVQAPAGAQFGDDPPW